MPDLFYVTHYEKLVAASASTIAPSARPTKLTPISTPPPRTTSTSTRTARPTTTPRTVTTAPPQKPKPLTIPYMQYKKIGQAVLQHLIDSEKAKVEVTEEALMDWYAKQEEVGFASEEERQRTVKTIIERLIENEGSVAVARPASDPTWPEGRVLMISGK